MPFYFARMADREVQIQAGICTFVYKPGGTRRCVYLYLKLHPTNKIFLRHAVYRSIYNMKTTVFVCLLLWANCTWAQQPKIQQQAITLKTVVEKHHISPRAIDDRFSEDLFNDIIKAADPEKIYFTAENITQLSVYKNQLDDELRDNGWNFLPQLATLMLQRSELMFNWLQEILSRDFEFATPQEFIPHTAKSAFEPNDAALKKYMQLFLKAAILQNMAADAYRDSTKKPDLKTIQARQTSYRKELLDDFSKSAKRKRDAKALSSFLEETYLQSLAGCFDPHTHYFSPKEYEHFMADLSGGQVIYGFSLGENDQHEIVIRKLAPGSPAWKCGELHRDDVLLSMEFEDKSKINFRNKTLEEVNTYVTLAQGKKITLTVKKKDGAIKEVSLYAEKVNTDDGLVKSFILEKEKKIGYIALPDFYGANGETTNGCASDVATEILRLKKENISGLIIDLRYNGGGSMAEAIDMAGIFIDDGPLFQERMKNDKARAMKDMNRGTIFDGPLLVLVNGVSASASEILAGTLQDYHRAIIAGGKTFGKATAQIVLPIDTSGKFEHPDAKGEPEFGFIKVTAGRLYRLNGLAAQHQGIVPDIEMPDMIAAYDVAEKNLPHSLVPDAVNANTYYKPLPPLNITTAKTRSEQRQNSSPVFKNIRQEIMEKTAENKNPVRIPLKWDLFEKYYRNELKKTQEEEDEPGTPNGFTVDITGFEKERAKINSDLLEANKEWKKRVQKSPYINEAFLILMDQINK